MQSYPNNERKLPQLGSRWFAVHTRYQHEISVADLLTCKGFEVFLPTYETIHKWADRNKLLKRPLFPGYLFVANAVERQIQILATPGVSSIVKAGGLPAEIPSEEISAIQRIVESRLTVEPHPFLTEGDLVRICAGPLAGLEGIISRKKDSIRLVLSIEILGRSAAVEIDGSNVERKSTSTRFGSTRIGNEVCNSKARGAWSPKVSSLTPNGVSLHSRDF